MRMILLHHREVELARALRAASAHDAANADRSNGVPASSEGPSPRTLSSAPVDAPAHGETAAAYAMDGGLTGVTTRNVAERRENP